jgi:hypothetical protein
MTGIYFFNDALIKSSDMTGSGIFLNYKGRIDWPVIDSLLTELKNTSEFQGLFTTTRKRTYSLIVESIENICKHSGLKSSDDTKVQPEILVKNKDNQITIITGNSVPEDKKEKLTQKLDYINSLDCSELKKMHETRINKKPVPGENGAGLGLICMAFKSGNKLSYRFRPLVPGYLFFELEICLNK